MENQWIDIFIYLVCHMHLPALSDYIMYSLPNKGHHPNSNSQHLHKCELPFWGHKIYHAKTAFHAYGVVLV